jgi:hypothetical protein
VEEDGGPLNGAARTAVVVGGLGGCRDLAETGPHGRSTVRRRRPSIGSATSASTVERNRRARVMIHL